MMTSYDCNHDQPSQQLLVCLSTMHDALEQLMQQQSAFHQMHKICHIFRQSSHHLQKHNLDLSLEILSCHHIEG